MTPAAPPRRDCRYQAAVVDQEDRVLLIRVRDPFSGRTFWLVPGGGQEGPEAEEECVCREVREETGLEVEVVRLLWQESVVGDPMYLRVKTYLCRAVGGILSAGSEPEFDQEEHHIIEEASWFPLRHPDLWGPEIAEDPITFEFLRRLSDALAM